MLRCRSTDGPAVCVFICLNPIVDTSGRAPTITRAVGLARRCGVPTSEIAYVTFNNGFGGAHGRPPAFGRLLAGLRGSPACKALDETPTD